MRNSKKSLIAKGCIVCMAMFIHFNTCINYELNEVLAWVLDNAILSNIKLQYYLLNIDQMIIFYIRIVMQIRFAKIVKGSFRYYLLKQ